MVDAAQLETQCVEMPSFPPPRTFTGRGYHPEAITPERKRWHPTNGAHLPAFGLVSAGTREQQVRRKYHTFDPRQPFRTARWDYCQKSMNWMIRRPCRRPARIPLVTAHSLPITFP